MIAALSLLVATANAGDKVKFLNGTLDIRGLNNQVASFESDQQIWLVQFKNQISAKDLAALKQVGAKIYRYFPEDALVIKASASAVKTTMTDKIQGIIPYRGAFKLSQNLPTVSVLSKGHRDLYTLTVIDDQEVAQALNAIRALDPESKVIQQSGRFLDIVLDTSVVAGLSRISAIEFVEPKSQIVPLNIPMDADLGVQASGDYTDLNGYETGTKVMNFDSAWMQGFSGAGEIVSFADTGLDMGNTSQLSADFQGSVRKGYTVGIGAKSWEDPMGHGTHVAGSIASRGTASGGKLKGGAYSAELIPEGMWSPIIDNLTVPPKLAQLFGPAMNDGATIHTNSWGKAADFGAYDSMAVQADEFLFQNPSFMVMFAAGNSGVDKNKNGVIDPNSIGTPGTAKNVLTVGASENLNLVGGIQRQVKDLGPAKDAWSAEPIWSSKLSDNPNGIACFSSRGPTNDGRLKPEVVAPGTNILSNFSQVKGANQLWGKYNELYVYSGGTSMATPLAAGAAAVTREFLQKRMNVQNPSGALLKATLMHTAVDLFPGQYGQGSATQELTKRPNNDEGYGRVDLKNVVDMTTAKTQFVDNKMGVATGEESAINLNIQNGQSILANLVYMDAPGSPSAAAALVNNLDLILVDSSGREIASHDRINNHEIIERAGLNSGNYRLIVRGINVPMGKNSKQPYALVYTVK